MGGSVVLNVVRPRMWLTDHTLAPPQTQSCKIKLTKDSPATLYHCLSKLYISWEWAGVESLADRGHACMLPAALDSNIHGFSILTVPDK